MLFLHSTKFYTIGQVLQNLLLFLVTILKVPVSGFFIITEILPRNGFLTGLCEILPGFPGPGQPLPAGAFPFGEKNIISGKKMNILLSIVYSVLEKEGEKTMVRKYLKEKYKISNYEMAQIEYLFKSVFSELSKMILMGILFHRYLGLYLFALCIMLYLRTSTGGLHFYTYAGCLVGSILYLGSAVILLPNLALPVFARLAALLACILICYRVGPVVSKYRSELSPEKFQHCRNITCTGIFIYALATYIIPDNQYITVGFWIIILHSLQLPAAKIRKKGELGK